MNGTATKVTELPTIDYAAAMAAPLLIVASDAGALGIRPRYLQVSVNEYEELVYGRPWAVSMQADGVADVDRIGDHYSLGEDDGSGTNYTRYGIAVLQGVGEVTVRVYCGRPDDDGAEATR